MHLQVRNFGKICIILSFVHVKSFTHFALFLLGVLKLMHPETEQNHSSTLGLQHLYLMDILKNVLMSRASSRFLTTTIWILFFDRFIYC